MQQNSRSLTPAVAVGVPRSLSTSLQLVRSYDNVPLYLSLALLVLSTIDNGAVGTIVKLIWLASVAVLAFTNIGAAFAAYIGSIAIYSPLHYEGVVSPLQRPDNYALVILCAGVLLLLFNKKEGLPRFNYYMPAIMAFFVLHAFVFSRAHLPETFRDILLPLLVCEFMFVIEFREAELNALQNGVGVLAGYMGLVSILERIPAYDWILPPWVGNPSLRPPDPFLEEWIGGGRSGGTLLQPAWNGILLTLIFCFLLLRLRKGISWPVLTAMSLCVVGSFFTYTRGVWLGLALSLMWFPGFCRSLRQANIRRAVLACAAAVLLLAAGGYASERLQDSNTILYRFNLWGAGLRIVIDHPLTGVGFYNFGNVMPDVEQGFGNLLPGQADVKQEGAAPHNTVLTVLVEFGLVGFLLYVAVFFKIVQRARNNARLLWGRAGAAWIFSFVLIYLLNAQFVSAFEGTTNLVFFGFLGVIAGAQKETA